MQDACRCKGIACTDAMFDPSLSDSDCKAAACILASWLACRKLYLKRMFPSSYLSKALLDQGCGILRETKCCMITVGNGYGDWYASLSGSVRQNMRTAYNRLARDGRTMNLMCGGGKCLADSGLSLYIKRQKEAYCGGGRLNRILKEFFIRYDNPITNAMYDTDAFFNVLLFIDDVAAACMFCLKFQSRGSFIAVPRLAINTDFRFYSPGYIMINELVRRLASDRNSVCLDLGRGLEKYKLDLGGKIYSTIDFRKSTSQRSSN